MSYIWLIPLALGPIIGHILRRRLKSDCPFPFAFELCGLLIAGSATMVSDGLGLWLGCGFGWTLLALAAVDIRTHRLPDVLTLPLIPAGLCATALTAPTTLPDHLIGVLAGWLTFAGIAWLYRRWRGRDGLGMGDAKLLSALGAWLSWQALPMVIFLAASIGLVFVVLRSRPFRSTDRLPFGPFLALAGWLVWL